METEAASTAATIQDMEYIGNGDSMHPPGWEIAGRWRPVGEWSNVARGCSGFPIVPALPSAEETSGKPNR